LRHGSQFEAHVSNSRTMHMYANEKRGYNTCYRTEQMGFP